MGVAAGQRASLPHPLIPRPRAAGRRTHLCRYSSASTISAMYCRRAPAPVSQAGGVAFQVQGCADSGPAKPWRRG